MSAEILQQRVIAKMRALLRVRTGVIAAGFALTLKHGCAPSNDHSTRSPIRVRRVLALCATRSQHVWIDLRFVVHASSSALGPSSSSLARTVRQ
jgi:hypothetical protein